MEQRDDGELGVLGVRVDLVINQEAFSYFRRLARVQVFVEKNHHKRFSLRQVAKVAGYEETYFSTFFHRETGVRFSEWRRAIRIYYALQILSDGSSSCLIVARTTGFGSRRAFERAMVDLTGMTASRARREMRREKARRSK